MPEEYKGFNILIPDEFKKLYERLDDSKIKKEIKEGCPKCGHQGEFIKMALCCPTHGIFAGC